MKIVKSIVAVLVLQLSAYTLCAQGEIPVDLYTGTPSITIPLGSISAIDVSQPIMLSYDANSVGLNEVFGSGWRLQCAGSITREVRGLPDDLPTDDPSDRLGWTRFNSEDVMIGTEIEDFEPESDTSASTYGNEGNDYSRLNGYDDKVDTEPDIYSFNFNGMSGKFVFDNAGIIRTIPFMDIRIAKILTSGVITGFVITTNDGYKYTFTNFRGGTKQIFNAGGWTDVHIMTTQYRMYQDPVEFITQWVLTKMESPAGNYITYNFGNLVEIPLDDYDEEGVKVAMYHDYSMNGSYDYMAKSILTSRRPKPPVGMLIPSKIESSTGEWLQFVYSAENGMIEKIHFRDNRKGAYSANLVKSFEFKYMDVAYEADNGEIGSGYTLQFLKTLRETSGCERQRPYTFAYNLQHRTDASPEYFVIANYIRKEVAMYYANATVTMDEAKYPKLNIYPSEPMKERYRLKPISGYGGTVYTQDGGDKGTGMVLGALNLIEYPSGGRTVFAFEQHQYHDFKENKLKWAPGARIASIQYYDGTGATQIDKVFNYYDDNGKSTGRIFRKPIYHLPAYKWQDPEYPNSTNSAYYKNYGSLTTEQQWKYLTLRTEWDIAPNDSDTGVGYTRVKVTRTGAGWAIHEFNVPGVYGETSNGYWKTPETLIVRQSSSINMSNTIFPSGGTYRYPNAPNPFYDYARGLPRKVTSYSSSGKLVKKVVTTYQDLYENGLSQPRKVKALAYDRLPLSEHNISNNRIYLLSPYFLLTGHAKVPKADTVVLYDATDTTKKVKEVTEYFYNSATHRLLSDVKRTTSDGNIYRTKFKYPLDYANQTGEAAVNALKELADITTFFMNGSPIETVSTLQKPSGSEYVIGASVVKYKLFSGKPYPESQWTTDLSAPLAVGSFANSSVTNISGYKFVIDTSYRQRSEVKSYLGNGMPKQVMSPVTRDSSETGYGFNSAWPVVKASNAFSSQCAFADLDNTTDFSFTSDTTYISTGRSGKYAFYPRTRLTRNNLSRVGVNNYVISFWLKSTSTTNILVKLLNTEGNTVYVTYTITEPSTSGEFKYVQKIIPTSAITSSAFRVAIKVNGLSTPGSTGYTANLLPLIDDVFFFPEGVHMESYDYNVPYGVSMVTTGTGNASHITYDGLGREKYVFDRNLNMVKRNIYSQIDDNPLFAEFTVPAVIYANEEANFYATVPKCMDSLTFEWKWDTGGSFASGDSVETHTYTTTGWKTVQLRVSAPGYGSQTYSLEVLVNPEPIRGDMVARGVSEFNATAATYTNGYTSTEIATAPATGRTTFKVINVTGCIEECTYKWYVRDMGVIQTLTLVQNGGTEFTCAKVVTNTNSFQVSCLATASDGRTGWIGPVSVVVTHP